MSSPTRRSSSSTKKKTAMTNTKPHTGHRDIRGSFASPDPHETEQLTSASKPSHQQRTKPLSDALSEDSNTPISNTQQDHLKESTPRLTSPSRLTRQRVKEQREQESKPQSAKTPTPPTSTGTSSNSSVSQYPILDNVTIRWRRLTRGIPSPVEPAVSRATERKRKLTGDDSKTSASLSSRQRAVTFLSMVSGNKDSLDQDDPNKTMPISQIENRSKTSRPRKTLIRGNR
ncbi:hypothetical protein BGZ95_007543 [Linnemannia exigua]|uniref:Uncharacterized protein n=1 Tax=Linnemannia exigua TaxID=604196 RepID=A0AAD4H872_9FUNG|nr:hypothetical protein BGZ95_007543 [Linnemannia exigua]